MDRGALSVEEFLSVNRDLMIACPYQPGNLKISKKACLQRQKAAQKRKAEPAQVEDLFQFFVSQGLRRCQKCTVLG